MRDESPADLALQSFGAALTLASRYHDEEYAAEAQSAFVTVVYERDKERLGGDPPVRAHAVQVRPHYASPPSTAFAKVRDVGGSVFEVTPSSVAQGAKPPSEIVRIQAVSEALWEAILDVRWVEIAWTFPGSLSEVFERIRHEVAAIALPTLFSLDGLSSPASPTFGSATAERVIWA